MGQGYPAVSDAGAMSSSRPFELEISSDCASERQHSLCGHPTPAPSHGSSNTSYSPPNIEDSDYTGHHNANFYNPSNALDKYSAPVDSQFHPSSGPHPGDYGISHGWEVTPDGVVLPSAATDMSPMGGTGWPHMLEPIWHGG